MRRLVRQSTGATITVGFGATLVLILAIGGVSWVFSQRLASALDAITGNEFPCYRHVAALYARQNDIQAGLGGLAIETHPDIRRELEQDIDQQLAALQRDVRSYESFPHGDEEERRWQAVRVEFMAYADAARAQLELEGKRDGARGDVDFERRAVKGLRRLRHLDDASDAATDHLVEQMNRDAEDYRVEAVASIGALKRALLAVVLISSALTVTLAYATRRTVKKAEAARRSEAERALLSRRLELIARYGSDILLLCDRDGRIREANDSALAAYGYSREGLLARNLRDVIVGVDDACVEVRFREAEAGGVVFECTHRRRDGSAFPVEVSFSAIEVEGDRYYLGVSRDITERKRADQERKRVQEADAANRAKSAFLANMSHEIRTPLNAILGYSQLMARDGSLTADVKRNLEIINRSGEHLLSLVNDVLEMSKIEAGRSSLNPGTFDLRGMVRDLEAMFRLRAETKRLTFTVTGAEAIPPCVVADEGKVRQVLVNLLGNAVRFTREGGVTLRLSAERRDGAGLQIAAAVEDTGVGIAADEMGKLFEQFGQTESGRQAQVGTGLGLAISREHARLMGGDIQVASELGRGSEFRFEFPADEGNAEACAARRPARRVVGIKSAGAAPRVLVVDDVEANRGWLRQLLAAIGFEVREATDGEEAVGAWRAFRPALVLMDVRMPRMDGHQATRAIREAEQGDAVAIIAMTASVFSEDRSDVLRSGADDFIGKPVREVELLDKIQARLGLEYLYDADDASAGEARAATLGADPLAPEALAGLPGETLRAMREATWRGDIDRLHSLIADVGKSAPPAASALLALAERFDYEGLHRVLATREIPS